MLYSTRNYFVTLQMLLDTFSFIVILQFIDIINAQSPVRTSLDSIIKLW